MTLGQFEAVTRQVLAQMHKGWRHSVFTFRGLRPNGVYTIWIVLPDSIRARRIGSAAWAVPL